jgi:protein-L-isoaspartate(D-aspartate) O-methyltransferase
MSSEAAPPPSASDRYLDERRERMVRNLIEARGVRDPEVLAAMRAVPRHLFVSPHLHNQAYADFALPIGWDQTISQPWVVARMTELMEIEADHTVLEVGTGSGYQTAVLARLARWVTSLERIPELARQAIERMRRLDVVNVKIVAFDGSSGWSQGAPYDRILVTAGAPVAPQPLLEQLAEGGRLLVPEGDRETQRLMIYESHRGHTHSREAEQVSFVPLVGRHGWPAESR